MRIRSFSANRPAIAAAVVESRTAFVDVANQRIAYRTTPNPVRVHQFRGRSLAVPDRVLGCGVFPP